MKKRRQCILITGVPAAGKSYLAEYLSKYLLIPSISKDSIKEILFDTIGFCTKEEKLHLNTVSVRIMFYCAERFMKCGQEFILENNFEDTAKKEIQRLLEQYDYKSITVMMNGDCNELYKRFCIRDKSDKRHPGHVIKDFYPRNIEKCDYESITLEEFVNKIRTRGMDTFDVGEICFNIDTTDIDKVNWKQIADSINAMMCENREKA